MYLGEHTSIRDYLQYSSNDDDDDDALATPRASPDAANAGGGEEPTEATCFAYSNATASSSSSSVSFTFSPTASLLNTSLASYSPDDTEERGETRSQPLSSEDTTPASGNSPIVAKAAHHQSSRREHTRNASLDGGCSEDDFAQEVLIGQRFDDGDETSLPPMSFSSSRRQTGVRSKRSNKRAPKSADGLDAGGGSARGSGAGLSKSASSSRRSSMAPKMDGLAESHYSMDPNRGHRQHRRRHSGPPAAGSATNGRGTRTPPRSAHSSRPSSRRQSRTSSTAQNGTSAFPFLPFVSVPARVGLTKETVSTAVSVSVYVLVTFCAGVALLGILAGSYALSVGDDLKDRLIEAKLSAEEMVDMAKQEAKRIKIRLEKGVKKVAGASAWNGTGDHPRAGLDGRNAEGTDYRELLGHVLKQVTPPVVYTVSISCIDATSSVYTAVTSVYTRRARSRPARAARTPNSFVPPRPPLRTLLPSLGIALLLALLAFFRNTTFWQKAEERYPATASSSETAQPSSASARRAKHAHAHASRSRRDRPAVCSDEDRSLSSVEEADDEAAGRSAGQ